jgi:hypothetical protein
MTLAHVLLAVWRRVYKQQFYRSLKRLRRKGLVNATLECLATFSTVSIEKVLHYLIEAKKEQALTLLTSKKDLLSSWCSITKKEHSDS